MRCEYAAHPGLMAATPAASTTSFASLERNVTSGGIRQNSDTLLKSELWRVPLQDDLAIVEIDAGFRVQSAEERLLSTPGPSGESLDLTFPNDFYPRVNGHPLFRPSSPYFKPDGAGAQPAPPAEDTFFRTSSNPSMELFRPPGCRARENP